MLHEIEIEIVFLGKSEFEHDWLIGWLRIEFFEKCRLQQHFGFSFARAINVDFRFDDGH